MPIVIMKTTRSPIYQDWTRPHAIWEGDRKSANIWCHEQLAKDAAASIRNLIATINEYKRELEKVWEAIDNIGKLK